MTLAKSDQQTQQLGLEKVSVEMNALTEQLAVLQKRVEEATAAQSMAQQKLSESQGKAQAIKEQLDAAEQAALDAKDQLDLFQKSYQKPN